MKLFLVAILVLLLTGCPGAIRHVDPDYSSTGDWPFRPLEHPPVYNGGNSPEAKKLAGKMFVADVNAYAYYVYLYAKSLNNYAEAKGWRTPMAAPLCEEFIRPTLHDIPSGIYLDPGSRSPQDISRDLSRQIKSLIRSYREDRESFNHAYERHKSSCLVQ